ncbi:MAG: hypothetical protein IJ840_05585 [Bacteroidales bacterium]|nr:hypothetical protein [Bacteroidales bacterium]
MRRRRFCPDIPNHVCRRPKRRSAIFYCLEDCLVFFTVFCVNARRSGIRVLGLALMFDHFHETVQSGDKATFSGFHRRVATDFSREYFSDLFAGSGQDPPRESLFEIPFQSAPKFGAKNVRTNLAYLYNNPVERHIKDRAIKWRWNFLAYCQTDHPFSEKYVAREASRKMRRSVAEVKGCHTRNEFLRYSQIRRLFRGLSRKERAQLVDVIISTYNIIDYGCLKHYFGSIGDAIIAIDSNTGSEYDIKEERYSNPDLAYGEMIRIVEKRKIVARAKDVILLPVEKRMELKWLLMRETSADEWQASKFLWLDLPPRR